MKRISQAIIAAILLGSLTVQADTFLLKWQPPTENEDGTPVTEQDLAFYTVYVDSTPLVNLNVMPGTWEAVITIATPGSWPVYMTVTNIHGTESRPSNSLTFTVGLPIANPPAILVIEKL